MNIYKFEEQIVKQKNYIPLSKNDLKNKKVIPHINYKFILITIFILFFLIFIK